MSVDPAQPHCGRLRGIDTVWDVVDRVWRWADSGAVIDRTRPCWCCGKPPVGDKDACLAHLPDGVTSACCGHGRDVGYIAWLSHDVPGRWLAYVRVVDE